MVYLCSESWTRTSDLRVMSPTSYLLLYLAMLTVQIYGKISADASFFLPRGNFSYICSALPPRAARYPMRKKRIRTTSPVVYFRRWARHRYAAFASLGRQVKIARLRTDMCQGEEQKGGRTFFSFGDIFTFCDRIGQGEIPSPPDLQQAEKIFLTQVLAVTPRTDCRKAQTGSEPRICPGRSLFHRRNKLLPGLVF